MRRIKISNKMMKLRFNGCEPEYIENRCHASCCDSKSTKSGCLVTIHPSEVIKMEPFTKEEAFGNFKIINGIIETTEGRKGCPFKLKENSLCILHGTEYKPFGCIASPFTLNPSGTLIVRNRYKLLKCYNDGRKLPAYRAFKGSLIELFGSVVTEALTEFLDESDDDVSVEISDDVYFKLIENDIIKKNNLRKEEK